MMRSRISSFQYLLPISRDCHAPNEITIALLMATPPQSSITLALFAWQPDIREIHLTRVKMRRADR